MIKLTNLTKRYDRVLAVNKINLSIPDGEIFGFIGPNGAGKTTTIRMLGGVLAPTEGSIMIDGINMAKEPEKAKKKIGFIPDRPFLYEKLTGMEFMQFSADLYEVNRKKFSEKAPELLKAFELHEWAHELIESYSHGMKQRLIFCAALLHNPELMIVDEPMVGLDPAAIKMVKNIFRNLAQNGTTIFMSTHTLEIAENLCHRIAIIDKGSLIALGTPAELTEKAHMQNVNLEEVFLKLTQEKQLV
jgi:ABC-2 type transport system ATP-binding protein